MIVYKVYKERIKYVRKYPFVLRYFLKYAFNYPELFLNLIFIKTRGEHYENFEPIDENVKQLKHELVDFSQSYVPHAHWVVLYNIVINEKPDIIVETGVWQGVSSAFILDALAKNKRGTLYSIDLPAVDGAILGEYVPDSYKKEWKLILEDSKTALPKLLNELGEISIFIHDSLHTYNHMMFEYTCAWDFIKKGGLLISHDIFCNDAFLDFAKNNSLKIKMYVSGLGAIRK